MIHRLTPLLVLGVVLVAVPASAQSARLGGGSGGLTAMAQMPRCDKYCLWQTHPNTGDPIGVGCAQDVISPPSNEQHGRDCSTSGFDCSLFHPCPFGSAFGILRPDGTVLASGTGCSWSQFVAFSDGAPGAVRSSHQIPDGQLLVPSRQPPIMAVE